VLGRQGAGTVGSQPFGVYHGPHDGRVHLADLGHLVRGAETVEEVQHRDVSGQGGRLGDEGEVLRLLHRVGGQQGEAIAAAGHDVAVIAEDGQSVGGERTGRYMQDEGRELAGDLVHCSGSSAAGPGRR